MKITGRDIAAAVALLLFCYGLLWAVVWAVTMADAYGL